MNLIAARLSAAEGSNIQNNLRNLRNLRINSCSWFWIPACAGMTN